MAIVRFNDWDEFERELAATPPSDKVVRVTLSMRYDATNTQYLTFVAGFLIHESLFEYVEYLGVKPKDSKSERSLYIQGLLDGRKRLLEERGYTVRPGRYHASPAR